MRRFAALLAAVAACAGPALAQTAAPAAVKAAFIYNFARFTTWPEEAFDGPDAPLVVCAAADGPLTPELRDLDGKAVGARVLRVSTAADVRCHVRVHGDPADLVQEVGVLTVGDASGFTDRGGAIALLQVGRQIRFQVNISAVDQAGLSVSSKLLRLALEVTR